MSKVVLRAANNADIEAIAQVWYEAWSDGHTGNVPTELHAYRKLEHFQARVPQRIANTTVAIIETRIAGFATTHNDELEQIFVTKQARGTGAATELLAHAEHEIGKTYAMAWLAVVAGNHRAQNFYKREGWQDRGPIQYAAETKDGPLTIPTHRYEKTLAR
jgi:GNAT superfamily N-acetyltransferase